MPKILDGGTHRIELPKKIVVGEGVLMDIGGYSQSLYSRGEGFLVITGPRVISLYYKIIEESMKDKGFNVWPRIVKDASVETAEEVAEEAMKDGINVLIGMGGGRSIDIAKYAAAKTAKSFISIPTVASHDGITSPFASLKGFEKPISRKAKPPDMIVLDVDVISKAPKRYNIAGFGDLIAKYTAVLDWRLASRLKGEYYGEYAASLALLSARHVSTYAREIAVGTKEGYRILLEALVSSGVAMCIAGSTRPASGSEHLFAHALFMTAKNQPLHGEAVGVGTIMMTYLHGRNWVKVKKLLSIVGAPTTAKELGVSDWEVVEALVRAARIRPERYTILGEQGLTYEAAERLAKKTGVIG